MTDNTPPSGNSGSTGTTRARKAPIGNLKTGVPGLDAILGGGLPEFSFNMLAGGPGAGKTTLAQQILFTNASRERPALYFTVLGEPTLKMLRYQQQFDFFKPEMIGSAVQYVNLSQEVLSGKLGPVLDRITAEVERVAPGIVVVDSFRNIRTGLVGAESPPATNPSSQEMPLEQFVQQLGLHLTSWEVTSILIGEYSEPEQRQPLFTIADGIIWLTQATDRNSIVRKLQAVKVRGRAQMPGLHTFRINQAGLEIFPRIPDQRWGQREARPRDAARLSTGVPGLDTLMGGGVPAGDAIMIVGPTGTGKSTFGRSFAANGLQQGEAVVIALFEEYPADYLASLTGFGVDTEAMVAANKLRVTHLRPLDLSVDETLAEILENVHQSGARRVIIDSLTGLEAALAPAFREDFRESLYRLVGALTVTGVTVFMVHESVGKGEMSLTGERVSFITDDILVQRCVEVDGVSLRVLEIVKMRRSDHSQMYWRYEISGSGATIGEPLTGYSGISKGHPKRIAGAPISQHAGLTEQELKVLNALVRQGEEPLPVLAVTAGVSAEEVARCVDRLLALDYVVKVASADPTGFSYRAVARPPESS